MDPERVSLLGDASYMAAEVAGGEIGGRLLNAMLGRFARFAAATAETIGGAAQGPINTLFRRNTSGARTGQEAASLFEAFLDRAGEEMEFDLRVVFLDEDSFFRFAPDSMQREIRAIAADGTDDAVNAFYKIGTNESTGSVGWAGIAESPWTTRESVTIYARSAIAESDEAIVTFLSHEWAELTALRAGLGKGSVSVSTIKSWVDAGRGVNLHSKAWDAANALRGQWVAWFGSGQTPGFKLPPMANPPSLGH